MKVKNKLYPYPLLADYKNDYVGSKFDVNYSAKNEFNQFVLNVDFLLTDEYIQSLINTGRLTYLVHVECSVTAYRKIFTTTERSMTIPVKGDEVRNTLQVASFIVATSGIENYSNPNFNQIYQEYSFNFKKGDTIAGSQHKNIEIVSEYVDPQSVPSVITVVSSDVKVMEVDTDGSKIIIRLPKELFSLYNDLANTQYQSTIISIVILPALVEVLSRISDLEDESREEYLENKPWFRVIENVLKDSGFEIDDIGEKHTPLVFAQMILQTPAIEGLKEIKREIEREEADET